LRRNGAGPSGLLGLPGRGGCPGAGGAQGQRVQQQPPAAVGDAGPAGDPGEGDGGQPKGDPGGRQSPWPSLSRCRCRRRLRPSTTSTTLRGRAGGANSIQRSSPPGPLEGGVHATCPDQAALAWSWSSTKTTALLTPGSWQAPFDLLPAAARRGRRQAGAGAVAAPGLPCAPVSRTGPALRPPAPARPTTPAPSAPSPP